MNPHTPTGYALRYITAHATTVLAANAFVLLLCVALQGVLMNAVSARYFQWISRTVQLFLLFLFVCLFFLLPRTFSFVKGLNLDSNSFTYYLPPLWFTGLYETLQGHNHSGFQALAKLAVQSLACAMAMSVFTYLAGFKRHFRRSLESAYTVSPGATGRVGSVLQKLDALFLRKPAERAVFHFACRTILRSSRHRLYLGAYVGVGLALTLVGIASTILRSADIGIERYDPPLLSIPLVMSFFILCGLRFIFAVPAELNANWIFRSVPDASPQEVLSGVRKVMWTLGVLPLPAALFPFYAALWGVEASLFHLIFVFTLAGILAEILLVRFQKVPFTCSYLPGKANLKLYWFPYVASFLFYVSGMASIERILLEHPVRFVFFYATAFFGLCYLKVRQWKLPPSQRVVIFEEHAEPAVRSLNLGH